MTEKRDPRKANPMNVIVIITAIVLLLMWLFGAFDYKKETVAETRAEQLQHQFSSWDGSHIKLTEKIKRSMNDADSYEHVETQYWDQGNTIIVKTTFRGANAFGGKVLNSVRAVVDNDGNILEMNQE